MKPGDAFRSRPLRDALTRLRAALLDLQQAGRHAEAAEVRELVKRIEAST